ncbi:mucin-3B-like isoform X2 [Spea bombifrons]|uniref:mucin-3B-like isoform X2 n=1 Tax=Spea bombifrons TaxID=233779 RepID=UPI002349417F|nr:mucin-3B-like isoform X2 [Spea bombifrons]
MPSRDTTASKTTKASTVTTETIASSNTIARAIEIIVQSTTEASEEPVPCTTVPSTSAIAKTTLTTVASTPTAESAAMTTTEITTPTVTETKFSTKTEASTTKPTVTETNVTSPSASMMQHITVSTTDVTNVMFLLQEKLVIFSATEQPTTSSRWITSTTSVSTSSVTPTEGWGTISTSHWTISCTPCVYDDVTSTTGTNGNGTLPTDSPTAPSRNVCENGYYDGIKCICPDTYIGPKCEFETDRCENGGYKENGKCVCPAGFKGATCEFADSTIVVDSVDVSVKVTVKILNRNFTDELKNHSSDTYKDFIVEFNLQMKEIYKSVKGFKDIKIIGIEYGSVIVDHEVIVETPYTENLEEDYNEICNNISSNINTADPSQTSCDIFQYLCFAAEATNVTGDTNIFNANELCERTVPPELSSYYYAIRNGSSLSCISNCTQGYPSSVDCNFGECMLSKSGPTCLCLNTNQYWFSGKNCGSRISRPGVIGGVTGTLAVLILLMVVAIVHKRRKRKFYFVSGSKNKYPDDENLEWSDSEEIIRRIDPTSNEEVDFSFHRGNFTPDLERVDTSTKVQIKRPEIKPADEMRSRSPQTN